MNYQNSMHGYDFLSHSCCMEESFSERTHRKDCLYKKGILAENGATQNAANQVHQMMITFLFKQR